jgi:hypothetical protein
MVDIILCCNNGAEIYKLPIPPEELPEITKSFNNSTLTTSEADLMVMGSGSKRSLSLEFMIPEYPGKYSWSRVFNYDKAMDYYNWLDSVAERRIPLRMIVFNGFEEILNIALAIDSLKYKVTRRLDVEISMEVSEFKFV